MSAAEKLSPKQRRFCELVASGKSHAAAYRAAGYKAKDADTCASRLSKKVEVAAYILELEAPVKNDAIATREETLEVLTTILRNGSEEKDIIAAAKQLAAMNKGWNAPQESEVTVKDDAERLRDALSGK